MNALDLQSTAAILLAAGVLLGAGVLLSRALDRTGVFTGLLFLAVGMLAGENGPGGIEFDDFGLTYQIGVVALVMILFDGGLHTSMKVVRTAIGAATVLATFGVLLTALLVAVLCRAFGFTWTESLLIGVVVSPTDAAAVFGVLRNSGVRIRERLAAILELESGLNDPIAFILTIGLAAALARQEAPGPGLLAGGMLQLTIGAAWGLVCGVAGRLLFKHLQLRIGGLYALLAVALAMSSYGLSTMVHGNGFVTVYVAGVLIGNGAMRYRAGLLHAVDSFAWFSQGVMFLALGLLVNPARLPGVAPSGVAIALFLALVARPVATTLCLIPFRLPARELTYLGWVGMRGAVPIILATIPVLLGAGRSSWMFDVVFFVVLVNAIVPGATVSAASRWLKVHSTEPPEPPLALEITTTRLLQEEVLSFHVHEGLAVCGASIKDIPFPPDSAVSLLIRDEQLLAPRGDTRLLCGDHVFVFCKPADKPLLMLLFGRPGP